MGYLRRIRVNKSISFSKMYVPAFSKSNFLDEPIHECVIVKEKYKKRCREAVENIFRRESTSAFARQYNLSYDEICAVAYYTVSLSNVGGNPKHDIFRNLNKALSTRNTEQLKIWGPFLRHFLSALNKLPDFTGKVFRAIDAAVPTKCRPGTQFQWTGFTSTSQQCGTFVKTHF